MLCRVCGLREDQGFCQHADRDSPPETRYMTTNSTSLPHSYSNLTHEAYISNFPHYSQSEDANIIGSESTHQLQEQGLAYSSAYPPSNQLFSTSTGKIHDSPCLSFHPGTSITNAHSQGSSVRGVKQSHLDDEAIQSSIPKLGQSIEPELGWSSLGNPDTQRSFNTAYPSNGNFASMESSQAYPDLLGYDANNWEQYQSQQNNLVASGNGGIQVATEYNKRINQADILLRGPELSDTSEAHYTFVNMAQSQYSPSCLHDSQIQKPFTLVATNQQQADLDNQNQYSPPGAINHACQLPCKCPYQKCKSNNRKVFTEFSDLQAHWYRAHEKRFSCPECNAPFGTTADVKRHSKAMHVIGPKEFTCEVARCSGRSQEFNRKHRLKEHKEKWHGSCYCSEINCTRGPGHGFKDQKSLNKHLIKSHGYGGLR